MAAPTYDVRGRRVLITGAARGIGAESARRLAGRGARLALVGVEPDRLEALAAELGGGATWHEADVRDTAAVHSAVDAAAERFGGIDVVMANAGIATIGTVKTIDPDAFERQVDVNLLGVWRTARAALPHVTRPRGYLLNVASLAAALHAPLMASYSATKAGVEAFSDSLRLELTGTGVHVGVAYFGEIDTDMVAQRASTRPASRPPARAGSTASRGRCRSPGRPMARARDRAPGPPRGRAPLPLAAHPRARPVRPRLRGRRPPPRSRTRRRRSPPRATRPRAWAPRPAARGLPPPASARRPPPRSRRAGRPSGARRTRGCAA